MADRGNLFKRLNLNKSLIGIDIYTIAMLVLYSLCAILLSAYLDNVFELLLLNFGLMIGVVALSVFARKHDNIKSVRLFRRIILVPIVFLIYSQVQNYIHVVNPELYDDMLIKADYAIFGVNPTEWLGQFAFPALTEFLQVAYFSFFLLPILHAVDLHMSKKDREFNDLVRMIIFAFYFSYLLYFFLPAIGPRFFVHDFFAIDAELPGLFFTDFIRDFVNNGGGIPAGCTNPVDFVNRDCMPSGHTMITLVNIWLAYKYKAKIRYIIYIMGFSLIFATLYLRYHYVVDVLAGALFAYISLLIEPKIRGLLRKLRSVEQA